MKAKRCEICNTRPVMTAAQAREFGVSFPYCPPCMTQADWGNTHSDHDHEGLIARASKASPRSRYAKKIFAELAEEQSQIDRCWICHPELDETTRPYVEREGTTREGVVHTVPLRASGKDKAATVAEALGDSYKIDIKTYKGVVTLRAISATQEATLRWDVIGHFLYGASTVTENNKGRKVRNASEAIRLLAA